MMLMTTWKEPYWERTKAEILEATVLVRVAGDAGMEQRKQVCELLWMGTRSICR